MIFCDYMLYYEFMVNCNGLAVDIVVDFTDYLNCFFICVYFVISFLQFLCLLCFLITCSLCCISCVLLC